MMRNLSYQIRRSKIMISVMTKMTSEDYYLVTKWDGRCVDPSSSEFEAKINVQKFFTNQISGNFKSSGPI